MKKIILVLTALAIAPMSMAQMYSPNMYGTGMSQAYPPCPYPQSSVAGIVTKKSERFDSAASRIRRQLKTIQNKLDKLSEDRLYKACESAVSKAVKGYCGTGEGQERSMTGTREWNKFRDHMTGAPVYVSKSTSYEREYILAMQGVYESLGLQDPYRLPAGEVGNPIRGGNSGGSGFQHCDSYALGGGGIDPELCDAAAGGNHLNSAGQGQCHDCLKRTPSFPSGVYPARVKEVYDLQQEEAQLKNALEIADAKVACAQSHLDGELQKPSEFRECILDADPLATTAEYCLTCDESGKEKKEGVDWGKWLPGLISAGLWTAGGFYAHNQMEQTRQGNWEAGYPSDDRQPWVMTNYVMNGANQVMDTFKASGAFGCAPTGGLNGQGVMGATNMNPYASYQFGGSPFMGVNGALGYPPGMITGLNGQLMMGGGLYGNNPMGMHMGGNLAAQQAQLQQQQAMLQYAIQQGQRDLATMQALAQLDAQINQIQLQRNQIFASNPSFGSGMYGSGGMYGAGGAMYGAGGAMYGGVPGGGVGGGLFGSIQGNVSIGMYGTTGMYGSPGMYGGAPGMYGGAPGMYGTPGMYGGTPVVPPYTGPGTGGTTVPSTGGNTGSAVPSLGL